MSQDQTATATILIPTLDPVDELVERNLKKQLRIEQRARQEGRLNRPPTDSTELDEVQQNIVDICQNHLHLLQQWVVKQFKKYVDHLPTTDASPAEFSLSEYADVAHSKIRSRKSEAAEELESLRVQERFLERERRFFQHENKLYRSAEYPSSRLLAVGILLSMILAESAANAYLFAQGNEFGMLGGILQAFVVSLVNVGVAFFFGMFILRNLHHVKTIRWVLALLLFPVGIAVLAGFNLAVAHYRDLLGIDPDNALMSALTATRADPFGLVSLESLILLLIGTLICIIAAWDGYSLFDDPYPGYGKLDRRYQVALRVYTERKRQLRASMLEVVEEANREIDGRIASIEGKVAACSKLLAQCGRAVQIYNHSADHDVRLCYRLLKSYREENSKVRTEPSPSYFDKFGEFEWQTILTPQQIVDQEKMLIDGLDSAKESAREARQQMQDFLEGELSSLMHFVDEVEKRAEPKVPALPGLKVISEQPKSAA